MPPALVRARCAPYLRRRRARGEEHSARRNIDNRRARGRQDIRSVRRGIAAHIRRYRKKRGAYQTRGMARGLAKNSGGECRRRLLARGAAAQDIISINGNRIWQVWRTLALVAFYGAN